MKRTILIFSIFLLLWGCYCLNKSWQLVAWNTLQVDVQGGLGIDSILIKKGLYSGTPKYDSLAYARLAGDTIFYKGRVMHVPETDYGENDFLMTYNNRYYLNFRHFIFNRRNKHTYRFIFYRQDSTIFVRVHAVGNDEVLFNKPMHVRGVAH